MAPGGDDGLDDLDIRVAADLGGVRQPPVTAVVIEDPGEVADGVVADEAGGRSLRKYASRSPGVAPQSTRSRSTRRSAQASNGPTLSASRRRPTISLAPPQPSRRGHPRRRRARPGDRSCAARCGAERARGGGSAHAPGGRPCERSTGARTAPCRGPCRGGCASGLQGRAGGDPLLSPLDHRLIADAMATTSQPCGSSPRHPSDPYMTAPHAGAGLPARPRFRMVIYKSSPRARRTGGRDASEGASSVSSDSTPSPSRSSSSSKRSSSSHSSWGTS